MRFKPILLAFLALAPVVARRAAAQADPAQVEALAPLLMAEDQRVFDPDLFARSVASADPLVRRTAALAIGRIGDRRGTALLVPLLADPDSTVPADAFFAAGLLGDSTAVPAIIARLRNPDTLLADAVAEAAAALDRLGGPVAAGFVGDVLSAGAGLPAGRRGAFLPSALVYAWRLGAAAPTAAILPFASDTAANLRWRAVLTLGRLRAPEGGSAVLQALRDGDILTREMAARAMTRAYADTAHLAARAVENELVRLLDDEQAGVRVNALGALGSFGDSTLARKVTQALSDGDDNVRVEAAMVLGELRGSVAARALDDVLRHRDSPWALRRAALASLARCDTAAFATQAATWAASSDFRDRIAALDAWGTVRGANPEVFRHGLTDADPRVQAAALGAWRGRGRGDSAAVAAARGQLAASDMELRAAALDAVRGSLGPGDLNTLVAAWHRSQTDKGSDARLAVIGDLAAIARRDPSILDRITNPGGPDFIARSSDPVVRSQVVRSWPQLAARWGPVAPVETGLGIDDYRGIVRDLMLATADPHVTIDVVGRGSIDLELLGHEAPLTVANFLRLVDQHYFDGNRWHRVVPNFVVQDGDPTGTGDGGPGWSIRDEFNRERYDVPKAGMALSGPDTGGSQWFINLSPQPHLDAAYTIFGVVRGSYVPLQHILQGDIIRSIHR